MRLVLLVCPCPRHQYTTNMIARSVAVAGMVRQYRAPRSNDFGYVTCGQQAAHDEFLQARDACELQMLGQDAQTLRVPQHVPTFDVHGDDLQLPSLERFVRQLAPTVLVSLGCSHVGKELRRRATYALSMHFGFTPRYRGSGGLFWPLYNMDPERLGVSIISLDDDIDAGAIAHHSMPVIEADDTIHALACKTIIAGTNDLVRILVRLSESAPLHMTPPRGSGRVYYEAAYHPRHLQVVDTVMRQGLLAEYLADKEFRDAQVTRVRQPGLDHR